MNLEKRLDIDSQSNMLFATLNVLNRLEIKSKYMRKYGLTNTEYLESVDYIKDLSIKENCTLTIKYFEECMNKLERIAGIFKPKTEKL